MSQSKSISEGNGQRNSIDSRHRGTLHTGLLHGSLSLLSYISQIDLRRVARPQWPGPSHLLENAPTVLPAGRSDIGIFSAEASFPPDDSSLNKANNNKNLPVRNWFFHACPKQQPLQTLSDIAVALKRFRFSSLAMGFLWHLGSTQL